MRLPWLSVATVTAALSACAPIEARGDAMQLSSPRAAHSSIVLEDGRVLLMGGCVSDGCEVGADSSTVDVFDPSFKGINRAGTLLGPRLSVKAAKLPDGRVLLVGGWQDGQASPRAEIFDPATGEAVDAGRLRTTRGDVTIVTLADGRVLIAGGYDGERQLAGAEIFDPVSGEFEEVGALLEARSDAQAVLLENGRALVTGGATDGPDGTTPLASSEIFDPQTGRFTTTGDMTEARHKHAAVRLPDGRVLVIAGADARDREGKKRTVEIYDPARGDFAVAGRLHHARYKLADAVVLLPNGRVLIAGGARFPEIFDPATEMSEEVGIDLERSWNFMTAASLGEGRVLLAGGYSEQGLEVSDRAWLLEV